MDPDKHVVCQIPDCSTTSGEIERELKLFLGAYCDVCKKKRGGKLCGCAFPCSLTFRSQMLQKIHDLLGLEKPPERKTIQVCFKHPDLLKQAREACVSQREQALANSVQRRHQSAYRRGSTSSYASSQHQQQQQTATREVDMYKTEVSPTATSSEALGAGSNLDLGSSRLTPGVSVVEVTPEQQEQLQAQLDSSGGLTVEQLQMSLGEALSNAGGSQANQILNVNHHAPAGLSEVDANMAAAMADAGVSLVDIPVTTSTAFVQEQDSILQQSSGLVPGGCSSSQPSLSSVQHVLTPSGATFSNHPGSAITMEVPASDVKMSQRQSQNVTHPKFQVMANPAGPGTGAIIYESSPQDIVFNSTSGLSTSVTNSIIYTADGAEIVGQNFEGQTLEITYDPDTNSEPSINYIGQITGMTGQAVDAKDGNVIFTPVSGGGGGGGGHQSGLVFQPEGHFEAGNDVGGNNTVHTPVIDAHGREEPVEDDEKSSKDLKPPREPSEDTEKSPFDGDDDDPNEEVALPAALVSAIREEEEKERKREKEQEERRAARNSLLIPRPPKNDTDATPVSTRMDSDISNVNVNVEDKSKESPAAKRHPIASLMPATRPVPVGRAVAAPSTIRTAIESLKRNTVDGPDADDIEILKQEQEKREQELKAQKQSQVKMTKLKFTLNKDEDTHTASDGENSDQSDDDEPDLDESDAESEGEDDNDENEEPSSEEESDLDLQEAASKSAGKRSKLFKIQYNDYCDRILSRELKSCVRRVHLHDVKIVCCDGVVTSSSMLLGSMSSYFYDVLVDVPWLEPFKTMLIPDVKTRDVKSLLDLLFDPEKIEKCTGRQMRRIRRIAKMFKVSEFFKKDPVEKTTVSPKKSPPAGKKPKQVLKETQPKQTAGKPTPQATPEVSKPPAAPVVTNSKRISKPSQKVKDVMEESKPATAKKKPPVAGRGGKATPGKVGRGRPRKLPEPVIKPTASASIVPPEFLDKIRNQKRASAHPINKLLVEAAEKSAPKDPQPAPPAGGPKQPVKGASVRKKRPSSGSGPAKPAGKKAKLQHAGGDTVEKQMEKLFGNATDSSESEKRLTEGLNSPDGGLEDNAFKSTETRGRNKAKDVEAKMSAAKPQNRVGSPTKTTKKPPDEPLKALDSDSDVDDPSLSGDSDKDLDCSDFSEPELDDSSFSDFSTGEKAAKSKVAPVKEIEVSQVKDVALEAVSKDVDLGTGHKKAVGLKKGPSGSLVSSPTSNSDSAKSLSSGTRRRAK